MIPNFAKHQPRSDAKFRIGALAANLTMALATDKRLGARSSNRCGDGSALTPNRLDWPTRPVTIVVPFVAGGNTDMMARLAAERLAAKLGQPFVIENHGGVGGVTGAAQVARAAPDGYTFPTSASRKAHSRRGNPRAAAGSPHGHPPCRRSVAPRSIWFTRRSLAAPRRPPSATRRPQDRCRTARS
jgi:hypothetical protein